MLSKPINIGIIDDHALFRKTLKYFLSEQANIRVLIQAAGILDIFGKLKDNRIDILIVDIFMPGLNGNEALNALKIQFPHIKILVLSMSTDMALVGQLLDVGIHGFISKADEPDELLHAIKAASDDCIYRNSLFTEALYQRKQNDIIKYSSETDAALSDREKRMLQLIWEEKSNKEIADELFLGIRSIEKIRQDIKEKIGAKSTVGLLKYAIRKNIIRVGVSRESAMR